MGHCLRAIPCMEIYAKVFKQLVGQRIELYLLGQRNRVRYRYKLEPLSGIGQQSNTAENTGERHGGYKTVPILRRGNSSSSYQVQALWLES